MATPNLDKPEANKNLVAQAQGRRALLEISPCDSTTLPQLAITGQRVYCPCIGGRSPRFCATSDWSIRSLGYLLAVVMLVLSAGCNSSLLQVASSQPMVKIGLIAPFEELHRDDGYAILHAVQLAVSQRNAQGGVAGHQVALVALNDSGRPEEAAQQAAKLGIDPLVLGIIGPWQKKTAAGASRELTARGLPWITPVALEPERRWGGFSLAATPADVVRAAIDQVRVESAARALVVYSDQPSALVAAAEKGTSPDLSIILRPPLPDGGSDEAQGYVWLGDAADGAKLARQVAEQTGEAPVMVGDSELGSPVFRGRAGAAGNTTRYLSSGVDVSLEGVPASFATAYEERAGSEPSPQAVLAYDATNLLLDAIDHAGRQPSALSRDTVRQALVVLGQEGWPGLSGTVVWWDDGCTGPVGCWHWNSAPLRAYPVDHKQSGE